MGAEWARKDLDAVQPLFGNRQNTVYYQYWASQTPYYYEEN